MYVAFTTLPGRDRPPRATIAITARGVTEQLRNTRFWPCAPGRAVRPSGRDHGPSRRCRCRRSRRSPAAFAASRRASISLDLRATRCSSVCRPPRPEPARAHVLRPDYAALVLAQVGWTALCERELTADDYETKPCPRWSTPRAPAAACCWRR
ncbi:MAG: hypothetical protein ACLTYW_03455 [Collinsella sp.]